MIRYSAFTAIKTIYVPYPLEFNVVSAGSGVDITQMSLEFNATTTLTINGNGLFYDNLGGTNPGTTRTLNANSLTPVFFSCSSGSCIIGCSTNGITQMGPIAGTINAPLIGCDITNLTTLQVIQIDDGRHHPFTGNASALTSLSTLVFSGNQSVTTDVSNLHLITLLQLNGGTNTIVTGNIGAMTVLDYCEVNCTSTLSGSMNTCTVIRIVSITQPLFTVTVTLDLLTNLQYWKTQGVTITVTTVINITALSYLALTYTDLTVTQVNRILSDFWANRNLPKSPNNTYRDIGLNSGGSAAPTGQGITDKANLQAYRSPNNDPLVDLWRVHTN